MGYRYLNTGTAVPVFAAEPPLATEGSLYYNSTSDIFYICNGTQWSLVSNASPTTTGGTRTIDALSEGGTFSYDLGLDFEDDVDTDAQLTYTLASGTLPSGCTLPTTGNSAFTGTASNVSSNTNYTWTIKVTDTSGGTATQDYQQTINTVAATTTGGTVTISAVNEGSSASYDVDTNFTFTTGSTFSAYSLLSGSLPSGLSFNTSTGVISGTMGEVSSTTAYSFTIRATDTDGDTADQAYSWTITNVPFSATGGTITTYSGYRVHTFTSSASGASGFVPNKSGTVDYLIVAGGGGGGASRGGGAGAGGYRCSVSGESSGGGASAESSVSVLADTAYSVVVGAGGNASGTGGSDDGGAGNNSSFNSIVSLAGGYGRSDDENGASGGSGAGSGGGSWGGSGGSGTSGQGYAGGSGSSGNNYGNSGCGGGGAGGIGATSGQPSAANWGYGGAGVASSITGSSVTRASGGGGGAGNENSEAATAGGGGKGSDTNDTSTANYGQANTGGGGGGGSNGGSSLAGGQGGSGIVIIRYAI